MITALKQFGSDGEPLIKKVEETTDRDQLFLLWQTLRETFMKEYYDKDTAPFQVRGEDGSIKIVKNLEEFWNVGT